MRLNTARLSAALALAATVVTAVPHYQHGHPGTECSTGPVQCCNSVQTAKDPGTAKLLATVGVLVKDVNVPIGVTCTPISVVGLSGNSCSAQTVCCKDNSFKGVVAIGCTPINIDVA